MAYKTRYRPLERLGRDGWRRMDQSDELAEREIVLPGRRTPSRLLIEA